MVQVRVVNITRVSPSPATATSREPIRLSFLDNIWITLPPVQRLFLYHTDRPLPFVAQELRASLSRILPRFRSLAGTFAHAPDSGDVVISFSGDGHDGVDVREAEAEGADFHRLAEDDDHDIEAFLSLVPPLDVGKHPMPVFSVQITGFAGAGVAVGLSVHHMAADGKALWLFVDAWAAECRQGANVGCGGGVEPVLDRSVIKFPGAEELGPSSGWTLPAVLDPPKTSNVGAQSPTRHQLSRRNFVVSAASIAALRDRGASGAARPSAFVALTAHAWLTFLKAKGIPPDDHSAPLCFLADCRRHLDPPVGDEYFGNCVRPCIVQAKAKDLLGGGEVRFKAACAAMRKAIDDCLRAPLGDCGSWFETLMGLPTERLMNISASPRFRVYDHADFGWGRPRRVELVSMNKGREVALVAARDEEGGVQATVALSPLYMDSFASLFLDGLKQQT
ncbi:hypothetical protein Taro_025886 [Colocasia esculenta]|uniref:Uncharacterized protein n=1 Tax=Colocasia esculenta TaxID=4460 RepID=A0A843V4M2_COLES|nr:hypothetical protein [Colocasia esculenta]